MIILPDDPLARDIIAQMQQRFPILENPPGSNRSPEIDAMCRRWGVPLGSAWCALLAATCWADAGADVPPTHGDMHPAKAESWRLWALATGRFSPTPAFGAAPLYGTGGRGPAHHIGVCVVALAPQIMDLEGNTSETGFSREGTLTELKRVDLDRLIGYVLPRPAGLI